MDREKRWKRITALFLASVAVFGFAEYSDNEGQGRKKVQGQIKDTQVQADVLQTDRDSEVTTEGETEREEAFQQETGKENVAEQETESNSYVYNDAGSFVEGLAYFCIGDDYGFMDESMMPVFYLDCDSVSNFQDGLAYFSINGKYGYINKNGEIVIEPVYHDADYFLDGYAIIMKNGRFGVIDKAGKEVIKPEYQEIERGGENFVVQEGEKYQILNRNGESMLKSPCEEINNYYDPVVGFRDREQGISLL